jgi:chemotaxis protein MotB
MLEENNDDLNNQLEQEDIDDLQLGLATNQESNWLQSYSDVITILLCFFMLFFNEHKEEKNENFKQIITTLEDRLGEYQKGEPLFDQQQRPHNSLMNISQLKDVEIIKNMDEVDIILPPGDYFDLGKIELNEPGQRIVREVISKLEELQGKIIINIEGHTDDIPVHKKNKFWWKNNMELSAMRALRVRDFIVNDSKFQEQDVIITGYGPSMPFPKKYKLDNKKHTDIYGNPFVGQNINMNRRISINLRAINETKTN